MKGFFYTLCFSSSLASSLHAIPLTITCPQGNFVHQVELAQTPSERARGLMFRTSLPEDGGMLFRFPRPQPTAMWMKNTLIPLDMIFLDEKGRILFIHENATPLSTIPIGPVDSVSQLLEVNGGVVRKLGITKGCTVK